MLQKGTPKEMLFLEMGCMPIRNFIRERRLSFLHYTLNEDEESMVNKFFKSQLKNKTKKDWVNTVLDDLNCLGMDGLNFEEIKKMAKGVFKSLVMKNNE